MNNLVTTTYQLNYVALSLIVSIVGSFLGLTVARTIRQKDGTLDMLNTISASLALGGIGVWSMHFIGMIAVKLDIGIGYSVIETLVSLVAAVVATAMALAYASKNKSDGRRILIAGTMLGIGVGFMHYLGMFGLKFGGYINWDVRLIAVSIVIAVIAATLALWLAINTKTVISRVGAATVMGVAVCAMHYTGMAAAEFVCTVQNRGALPSGDWVVYGFNLPLMVTMSALAVSAMICLDQFTKKAG